MKDIFGFCQKSKIWRLTTRGDKYRKKWNRRHVCADAQARRRLLTSAPSDFPSARTIFFVFFFFSPVFFRQRRKCYFCCGENHFPGSYARGMVMEAPWRKKKKSRHVARNSVCSRRRELPAAGNRRNNGTNTAAGEDNWHLLQARISSTS